MESCGIHDVDLFMSLVHNRADLLTWTDKYSLFFLVSAILVWLMVAGVRDWLAVRAKSPVLEQQ